ncbi:nitroreductase family protein [Acidaminobacter sp. JC074]|uniref:nitroreductase family protein n=1 Tax=Acidaminobacter sp. JC074 TaxID=2530199 RepID=UPI001F0D8A50|nr:nitroreductase family protein [Acidaminobacter sp. JC074]MCH4888543.1 nitroreductase family protein [Acidaminobacter sp. JC074]
MKIIDNRRSVRSYLDKPVEQEKIEKILRAAMQAPSAGNQRPWEFVVVRNKTLLQKLSEMSPYSKMVASAPVAIVLLGKEKDLMFEEFWTQDMGACTQNLLLEIVEQGMGGVWLGVASQDDRMQYVKETLSLKEGMPFAVVPFGYTDKEQTYIDRYEEDRVTYLD